jgi:hypothetical protein
MRVTAVMDNKKQLVELQHRYIVRLLSSWSPKMMTSAKECRPDNVDYQEFADSTTVTGSSQAQLEMMVDGQVSVNNAKCFRNVRRVDDRQVWADDHCPMQDSSPDRDTHLLAMPSRQRRKDKKYHSRSKSLWVLCTQVCFLYSASRRNVWFVHGFASYLLSDTGCLSELDPTEVIMNYPVVASPESIEDILAAPLHITYVLNHGSLESSSLLPKISTVSDWFVSSFPTTIAIRLSTTEAAKNTKYDADKRVDYQFAMDCLPLQEGEATCEFMDPVGSCDHHFRTTGRGGNDVFIISVNAPSKIVAGYAAGHEAVSLTPTVRVILGSETEAGERDAALNDGTGSNEKSERILEAEKPDETDVVEEALEEVIAAVEGDAETVEELEEKLEVVHEALEQQEEAYEGSGGSASATHEIHERFDKLSVEAVEKFASTHRKVRDAIHKAKEEPYSLDDKPQRKKTVVQGAAATEAEPRVPDHLEKIREHLKRQAAEREKNAGKKTEPQTEEEKLAALAKALEGIRSKQDRVSELAKRRQQILERNSRTGESASRFDQVGKKTVGSKDKKPAALVLAQDSYRSFFAGAVIMVLLSYAAICVLLSGSRKQPKGHRDL